MGKIDLRIRDLKTDEEKNMPFDDEEAARAWLSSRPPFVEGIGVTTPDIDRSMSLALRDAMRPLNADEELAKRALDLKRAHAALEREREARTREIAAAEAHKHAMLDADPNRPMEIRWTFDGGMALTDQADPRTISEEAKEALLAWIAERNEWVKDRGQIVGEVTATLWPSKVPDGEERIQRARFFPVTAPAS